LIARHLQGIVFMPLLSWPARVALAARAAVGIFRPTVSAEVQAFLAGIMPGGRGEPPRRNTADFLMAYSTMPWLRAVVGKVSSSVAATTWRLYSIQKLGRPVRMPMIQRATSETRRKLLKEAYTREELHEVVSHPFLDLINGQNSFFVGISLRQLSEIYHMLVGEWFWLKERNGLGMPMAVWPLPPNWVQSTPTPGRPVYEVSFRGWQGEIPEREILWAYDPDPYNPYGRGAGISQALTDELETDEYMAKMVKAVAYNRARPDLIVSGEGLQRQDTERLETAWNQKYQGFWNAFRAHFVNRKVEIKELSQNFEHLQFVQMRTHERDTIMQVLAGMPPELLGVIENSNRSTIEAAEHLFAKWVMVPRLEFYRETLQTKLLSEFDTRLILDYDDPVPRDRQFDLQAATASPWVLNADEWRAMSGHANLEMDRGKVHGVPFGIQIRDEEDLMGTTAAPQAPVTPGAPRAPDEVSPPEIPENPPAAIAASHCCWCEKGKCRETYGVHRKEACEWHDAALEALMRQER
jgi:phage portal protein BeeE